MYIIKKVFFLFFTAILLSSCGGARISKAATIQLKFLDEYIIPKDLEVDGHLVGGLSDLDFDGTYFYTISDIPKNPIIYKFLMTIDNNQINSIDFVKATRIQNQTDTTKNLIFDMEGINFNAQKNNYTVSSEGSIKNKKNPFVADIDTLGNVLSFYEIPHYFASSNDKGLRNNGVFEGLSRSTDGLGFWTATELPMINDGPNPRLFKTKSPVRFTYYNSTSRQPESQFAYTLGRIRKAPLLPFSMNGLSGILEVSQDQFLVIERAFSAGHKNRGNRILIYSANSKNSTNTLEIETLKSKINKTVIPAEKKLVFDFNSVRKNLKKGFVDNIEGISWGPKLKNGNRSLLLISDNNFSAYSEQINQIILMEIIETSKNF